MRHAADIGIVGAGPAGARAAELLASVGARVVLLDPRAPWEKPCGGGLTAPAFQHIPELEELRPRARAVTSVRMEVGTDTGFTVDLDRPLWILSRRELGGWQLDRAVRAGAQHLPLRVGAVRRASGAWRLDTPEGSLTVPVLVGADGAASLVRRAAAPKLRVELAPARVAYPTGAGPTPATAVLRFYGETEGYLWDFPRPDHRSIGIVVADGRWRRRGMDGEIECYRASSRSCNCVGLDRAGAVIGTAQEGHGDYSRIADEDFALLGDAAGLADPFTGEGIHNAMRSAGLFAEAWLGGDLRAYPTLARNAFEREFRIARVLRRSLLEGETMIRLVERAASSKVWYAVVAAALNGVSEHDGRVGRLVSRWARTFAATWRKGGMPNRVRSPVPCDCGCAVDGHADGCVSAPRAA